MAELNIARFNKFLELSAMSPEQRMKMGIKSAKAAAGYLNISENQYCNYEKKRIKMQENTTDDDLATYVSHMKDLALGIIKGGSAIDRQNYGRILGLYVDKKEEKVTIEYSNSEVSRDSRKFVEFLRRELEKNGGVCPVCRISHTVPAEIRSN